MRQKFLPNVFNGSSFRFRLILITVPSSDEPGDDAMIEFSVLLILF